MQDPQTLKRLGEVDRELIEHRIRTLLELRAGAGAGSPLDFLAPDVVYFVRGGWNLYPHRNNRYGKREVAEMLAEINTRFENLGSVIHELVIDGDRVALHRTASVRNRGTGETMDVDICNFGRFRDGLIVELSEYPDTAALARLEGRAI